MNNNKPRTKRRKLWSIPRITHPQYPGYTVRVTELGPGGNLYAVRMVGGKQRMASLRVTRADLGTTEREQERTARARAFEIIAALAEGKDHSDPTTVEEGEAFTLGTLVDLYEKHGLHGIGAGYRRDQLAKVRRIVAFLGADRPVVSLCRSDTEEFSVHRRTGAKRVRQNTISGDVTALKIALNFAIEHKRADGRPLLDKNPLAKVRVPKDKPRRPYASAERYRQLKAVAPQLPPAFACVLELAWETGRRIGAILALRWQDISLETSEERPYGAIRWYAGAATDNKKQDEIVPMNARAREALTLYLEVHPGIGAAWVFPAPNNPAQALGRHIANRWLGKAEELAELEHLEQGGWRDTATLIRSYQHADPRTTLAVVNHGGA